MSKKHCILYDFLLPLAGVLLIGRFLAGCFDDAIFGRVDSIKAFGLGFGFAHSELRSILREFSWLVFAAIPAAGWMVWVRINLEYDPVRGRTLDRPVFEFFRALARWIESGKEGIEDGLTSLRTQARTEWPDDAMPPPRRQR